MPYSWVLLLIGSVLLWFRGCGWPWPQERTCQCSQRWEVPGRTSGFYFRSCSFKARPSFAHVKQSKLRKYHFYLCQWTRGSGFFLFFFFFFPLIFIFLPLKAAFQGNFESETSLSWECLPGIPQEPSLSPTCLCAEHSNHCSSATGENTHCRTVWTDLLRLRNERWAYKREKT